MAMWPTSPPPSQCLSLCLCLKFPGARSAMISSCALRAHADGCPSRRASSWTQRKGHKNSIPLRAQRFFFGGTMPGHIDGVPCRWQFCFEFLRIKSDEGELLASSFIDVKSPPAGVFVQAAAARKATAARKVHGSSLLAGVFPSGGRSKSLRFKSPRGPSGCRSKRWPPTVEVW